MAGEEEGLQKEVKREGDVKWGDVFRKSTGSADKGSDW